MSHSVKVTLIADQEIEILGKEINVHKIIAIKVDADGTITDALLAPERPGIYQEQEYGYWLSKER